MSNVTIQTYFCRKCETNIAVGYEKEHTAQCTANPDSDFQTNLKAGRNKKKELRTPEEMDASLAEMFSKQKR